MKTHTSNYKDGIKEFGREIDSIITYTDSNNNVVELGSEELNSITPHYNGAILKSVMKQLDIDSNEDIPLGTEINYQFGLYVNGSYEYLNFGNYIVYSSEKQEDLNSYKIICYDKMLYSMIPYESMSIIYPITIRNYIGAICSKLGLTFKNSSDTFANYNKEIPNELYLDTDGNDLGYTFRDVLDELAQVTASTICINEDDDELEIRYINQTVGKNICPTNFDNWESGQYSSTDGQKVGTSNRIRVKNLIEVQPNTDYYCDCFSSNDKIIIREYNNLGTFVKSTGAITNEKTFTTTANTYYISITLYSNTNQTRTYSIYKTMFQNGDIKPLVCLNSESDKSFEPYGDTIDEEYLKDVNVNFGEKFGAVNTIVLSRSAGADNIYYPSTLPENPYEIKISDNQIMNGNDRADYMPDIYDKLNGLEYYTNDFSSIGITYYNLCDRYNVKIGNEFYSCVMFNDEINVTQGLEENVYTELPEETETDYTKADKTDRKINQAYIVIDKQNQEIEAKVSQDGIIASLNLAIEDGQGVINAKGNTFILDADNASIDAQGNAEFENAKLRGGELILEDDGETASIQIKEINTDNKILLIAGADVRDAKILFDFEGLSSSQLDWYGTEPPYGDVPPVTFEKGEIYAYNVSVQGVVDHFEIALWISHDEEPAIQYSVSKFYYDENGLLIESPIIDIPNDVIYNNGENDIIYNLGLVTNVEELRSHQIIDYNTMYQIGNIKLRNTYYTGTGLVGEVYPRYVYTDYDVSTVIDIVGHQLTPTQEQLDLYDIDGDGEITYDDYYKIRDIALLEINYLNPSYFKINYRDMYRIMSLYNTTKEYFRLGLFDTYIGNNLNIGDNNTNYNITLNGTNILDLLYPVGSIYITKTNTNPSSRLGGTWSLIKKEFEESKITGTNAFTRNNSVCSSASAYVTRTGTCLLIELVMVASVNITDSSLTWGTLDLAKIGVNSLYNTTYPIGSNDGKNAIVYFQINTNGEVISNDIMVRGSSGSMPSGDNTCVQICLPLSMSVMLDSACDKFYWERTA